LSVDTDEYPSHIFRLTEADRLRDAFDRFGARLYAVSGQIGAEPFHQARGCGASLRSEILALAISFQAAASAAPNLWIMQNSKRTN